MNTNTQTHHGTTMSQASMGAYMGSTKQSTREIPLMYPDPQPQLKLYVLKKIPLSSAKLKIQLAAIREAQIMSQLSHPNIIQFHTSFVEHDCLYILMEYAEKGDLYKVIKEQRHKKKYISEKDLWDFAY